MDLLELVPKPSTDTINVGLKSAGAAALIELLGNPRKSYTGDCQPITNPSLKAKIKTESVGPFRATGHVTALQSLRDIFAAVKIEVPELHAILGSAGMECARLVRLKGKLGTNPSNHSWGLAIDIKLKGKLDPQGDDKVQRGLLVLARYFNAAGWYWGAAFKTEDGMHFEPSISLLKTWRKDGKI
nr:M15 family metallopeptidase [uncultured Dongia sp.]